MLLVFAHQCAERRTICSILFRVFYECQNKASCNTLPFGCVLWRLDCKMIRALETSFNKIWRLPRQCHTRILHCVAGVQSLFNTIPDLFSKFISHAVNSKSPLIKLVFTWASGQAWTAVGGNLRGLFKSIYSSRVMIQLYACVILSLDAWFSIHQTRPTPQFTPSAATNCL